MFSMMAHQLSGLPPQFFLQFLHFLYFFVGLGLGRAGQPALAKLAKSDFGLGFGRPASGSALSSWAKKSWIENGLKFVRSSSPFFWFSGRARALAYILGPTSVLCSGFVRLGKKGSDWKRAQICVLESSIFWFFLGSPILSALRFGPPAHKKWGNPLLNRVGCILRPTFIDEPGGFAVLI